MNARMTGAAAPGGRGRLQRRGTVLLMVIGVLALMAIIAVVYAALGRAEKSSATSLLRSERTEDQSRHVADYIAGVIGDGVFARQPEIVPANVSAFTNPRSYEFEWRYKAYDYPLVDEKMVSVYLGGQGDVNFGDYLFNATGDFVSLRDPSTGGLPSFYPAWVPTGTAPTAPNTSRLREPSTPFLSATEPTFVKTGPSNPRTGGYDLIKSPPDAVFRLLRDWSAISNLAPSGNFVNLQNLRGNFDAEPGFELDSLGRPRMSDSLTQFDANGNQPGGNGAFPVAPGQNPDQGLVGVRRADGLAARYNRPADWTMNQLHAFRPMVDVQYSPEDPRYLFNQWADADGDGFADSRWFELTRLTWDAVNRRYVATQVIPGLNAGRIGSNLRLFVAAKVIDNSALVNVNAASEFYREPELLAPPGLTPADIDLRRLLLMQEYSQFFMRYDGGMRTMLDQLGPYAMLPQPMQSSPAGNDDYRLFRTPLAPATGANVTAYLSGLTGYAALRDVLNRGLLRNGEAARYSQGRTGPGGPYTAIAPLSALARAQGYDRVAVTNDDLVTQADNLGTTTSYLRRTASTLFGVDDELELRTFSGINDDKTTSRLESTLGGRWDSVEARTSSVLRDNRGLVLERQGRDVPGLRVDAPFNPSNPDPEDRALLGYQADVRRLLTAINGSRPIIDGPAQSVDLSTNPRTTTTLGLSTRLDMTPIIAALRAGEFVDDGLRGTAALRAQADAKVRERYNAARKVYAAYVAALAPMSDRRAPWVSPGSNPSLGLSYSGSAERAMRFAAHMTLNAMDSIDVDRALPVDADRNSTTLVDQRVFNGLTPAVPSAQQTRLKEKQITDDDTVPTVMTLLLSREAGNDRRPGVNALWHEERIAAASDDFPWPALFVPNAAGAPDQLKLARTPTGNGGLAPTQGYNPVTLQDPDAERINMYGLEPQPFLIDVAFHSISVDAQPEAGGDKDGTDAEPLGQVPPPPPANITLHRTRDLENADFMCDVLTFTLQNPFDQRVYLYRALGGYDDKSKPRYYIQYANRYYLLAKAEDSGTQIRVDTNEDVFLEAGETRVFYVINPGRMQDLAFRIGKLRDPNNPTAFTTDNLRDLVRRWFGSNVIDRPIVMVHPETFQAVAPAAQTRTVKTPLTTGSQGGGLPYTQDFVEQDLLGERSLAGFAPALPDQQGERIAQSDERKVAMLWRVMRSPSFTPGSGTAGRRETSVTQSYRQQALNNSISTDLLADRLREPSSSSETPVFEELAGRMNTSPDPLSGRIGETSRSSCSTTASPGDNFGLVLMSYARFARPFDRDCDAGVNNWRGEGYLPAWCIESKVDRDTSVAWQPLRASATTTVPATAPTVPWSMNWKSIFIDDGRSSDVNDAPRSMCAFFGLGTSGFTSWDDLSREPAHARRRTTASGLGTGGPVFLGKSGRQANDANREYREVAATWYGAGLIGSGSTNRQSINPGLYSRVGDFLLPLAIGPEYVPTRPASGTTLYSSLPLLERESRWTTLSEMLALAADYYSPDLTQSPYGAVYAEIGRDTRTGPAAAPPVVPALERGGLVLDAWIPHVLIPGTSPPTYVPVRSGIPFALGVVDQFSAAPFVASTDGESQLRENAYGDIRTLQPGRMNVNTQPASTLRLTPMLAPDQFLGATGSVFREVSDWTSPGDQVGQCCIPASVTNNPAYPVPICTVISQAQCTRYTGTWTAGTGCAATGVCGTPPPSPPPPPVPALPPLNAPYPGAANKFTLFDPFTDKWDLASNIAAYRDRVALPVRSIANPNFNIPAARREDQWSVSYADPTPLVANRYDGRTRALGFFDTPRLGNTGGVREQRGIKSLGELFGMNYEPETPLSPGVVNYAQDRSMQLRLDNPDPRITGVWFQRRDTSTGRGSGARVGTPLAGTLPAKIAVANAAANVSSVRSDVFTVSFLMHGYTREDVEGLQAGEPMVPSLAKRYVMVVDRSNVVTPGDKPRIVLLREVPIE